MPLLGYNAASAKGAPTAPTIGSATSPTSTTASVTFTAPSFSKLPITNYTVTSSPGGITGTGSSSPVTVSGLTAGTAYTFTVNGTTNYGISSDSSAASNSVTPAVPGSFESIATITALSGVNNVTFTSIPGTYKILQLRYSTMGSTVQSLLNFQINGITTGSLYATWTIAGAGSGAASGTGQSASNDAILAGFGNSYVSNSTYPGVGIYNFYDYASTSKTKMWVGYAGNETNSGSRGIEWNNGVINTTTAITSIKLYTANTWASGTFALYGMK